MPVLCCWGMHKPVKGMILGGNSTAKTCGNPSDFIDSAHSRFVHVNKITRLKIIIFPPFCALLTKHLLCAILYTIKNENDIVDGDDIRQQCDSLAKKQTERTEYYMQKGRFTKIPDEWWKLCGKHTVVDEETGEIITESITTTGIILLAKIYSFCAVRNTDSGYTTGQCIASNGYFADALNLKKGTIKNTLSVLYKLRLLKSYEQREGSLTAKRYLYVNENILNRMLDEVKSSVVNENYTENTVAMNQKQFGDRAVMTEECSHGIMIIPQKKRYRRE